MPRGLPARMEIATSLLFVLMLSTPMLVRALDVGDKAPDFLAFGTVDESVRLSEYQGKKNVMMFFFVRAFGGV
jgi:AhpC/TSA family